MLQNPRHIQLEITPIMLQFKSLYSLLISVFVLSLLIINSGCSRPSDDVGSSISISLPQTLDAASFNTNVGTLSLAAGAKLQHVSVTVSGTGMAVPSLASYDSHDGNSVLPSSFTVKIPSGMGRLIQLLVVYKDPATGQNFFYYGDVTQDLTGGEVPVEIPIAQIGTTGIVTSGQVSGRYLTGVDSGPTGTVDMSFNPGAGKKPMIIETTSIVNGWFSVFMLSGVSFEYVIRETGMTLWGVPMSLDSPMMDPSSNFTPTSYDQLLRVMIPPHLRAENKNNVITYLPEDSRTYVWGYWGANASTKRVCTKDLYAGNVFQAMRTYTPMAAAVAPANPGLMINRAPIPAQAPPTWAQLADTTSPLTTVFIHGGGGPGDMSTFCGSYSDNAADRYLNFLKVTLANLDGNGQDNAATFKGIFRPATVSQDFQISGAPPAISGVLLPGVRDVISGLRLFKRPDSTNNWMNHVDCSAIAAGSDGFSAGSTTDAVADMAGIFSVNSNITAAEAASGVSVVVCPVKNSVVQNWGGLYISAREFAPYGGGGGGSIASQLKIISPQGSDSSGAIANSVCTPILLQGRDSSNMPAQIPSDTTFTNLTGDASIAFYTDQYCSQSFPAAVNFNGTDLQLYVKRTTSGMAARVLSISASKGISTANSNITFVDPPAVVNPKIKVVSPNNINAFGCQTVRFESWADDGSVIVDLGSSPQNFDFAAYTGLSYYMSMDCMNTTMTSSMLGYGTSSNSFSFKYTGPLTNLNLEALNFSPSAVSYGPMNISVYQPGAPTQIQAFVQSLNPEVGQCVPIYLSFNDTSQIETPATMSGNFNLSSTVPGNFYYGYDTTCSSATISLTSYSAADTKGKVNFKASAIGSGTISVTTTSPAFSVSTPVSFVGQKFARVEILVPGQYLSLGTVMGSMTPLQAGMPATVELYILLADNTVATGISGNFITSFTCGTGSCPSPGTINFVNGYATFAITPQDLPDFDIILNGIRPDGTNFSANRMGIPTY